MRHPASPLATIVVALLASSPAAFGGVAGKSFSGTFTTDSGATADSCMSFASGGPAWAFDQDFGSGRQGLNGTYNELDLIFISFWSATPSDGSATMSGLSIFGIVTTLAIAGPVPAEGFYIVSTCTPVVTSSLDGIHVATNGVDTMDCGDEENPCRTIKHGIDRANWGDVVLVHAGTFAENWIFMKSGVSVLSADGPLAAKIYSGGFSAVRFENVDRSSIDGFEIFGDLDGGPLGDGLLRVHVATNVSVRNSMIHDAPADCDVIKITYADGLLFENVVAYNPALRVGGYCEFTWQEVFDIFGHPGSTPQVSNVIVRGCWLFHTSAGGDYLFLTKRNTANIVLEGNVFGPSSNIGCGNPAVSLGNDEDSQGGFHVDQAIVRNNVFSGLNGDAALSIMNSNDIWVYNNVFYRNSGPALRSVVMFRSNIINVRDVHIRNNVFVENQPSMPDQYVDPSFYWVRKGIPSPFQHDHNLYIGNIAATDLPYTGEPNSRYNVNPLLEAPAVPNTSSPSLTRIVQIKQGFRLLGGSPALNLGLDAVSLAGHPHWNPPLTDARLDAFAMPRPSVDTWDLGLHERAP